MLLFVKKTKTTAQTSADRSKYSALKLSTIF